MGTNMNALLRAGRQPAEAAKAATGTMNALLRQASVRAPAEPEPEQAQTSGFEGGLRGEPLPVQADMNASVRAAIAAHVHRRGADDLLGPGRG